jgi:hypothetical protein
MFTQYKFSETLIGDRAAEGTQALALSHPGADPLGFAVQTISGRLRIDPGSYKQYGPYWWIVKAVLAEAGEDFGPAADDVIRDAYGEQFDKHGALIAGELFRDFYRQTFLVGTSQFWLDGGEQESYVLFDADMEARRLGPDGLRVSANLSAVELESEPVPESAA